MSPSSQRSRPGSNTCIEKINERRTSKGSTVFNKGDYAISVEWFHRVDTDAMGLSFSKHAAPYSNPNPNPNPNPDPNPDPTLPVPCLP